MSEKPASNLFPVDQIFEREEERMEGFDGIESKKEGLKKKESEKDAVCHFAVQISHI